jgi:Coenzyme PQQ synthesis protein D (PqqD)
MRYFAENQSFVLSNQQVSSQLSDETVVLNHQAGIYYGLNEVGTVVWARLQQKAATFAQLKALILEQFDTDEPTCEADLETLLKELLHEKLVETLA